MEQESKNLMQGLCEEIDRVKEILKVYESLPLGVGAFAAALMKQDVLRAEQCRNSGDAIEMIKLLNSLKEYEL